MRRPRSAHVPGRLATAWLPPAGRIGLALVAASFAIAACGDPSGPSGPGGPVALEPVDLSGVWATSTAADEGFDVPAFEAAFSEAPSIQNLRALVVVRNGRLVRDAYFGPAHADSAFDMRSVTKSVTAIVTGIAVDRGLLDVEDRMVDWLPGEAVRPEHDPILVRHLLTMTSGMQWSDLENFNPWALSGEWITYVLDLPVVAAPGQAFIYNTGGSHLLSVIIGNATGESALALAERDLFGPLGIDRYRWPILDGHPAGGVALALRPLDAAKIGQVLLQGGVSGSTRLVPEAWIDAQTGLRVELGSLGIFQGGYGYQTWVDRTHGAFVLWGYGGQFVWCVPDENLVIVTAAHFQGVDDYAADQAFEIATRTILPLIAAAR